MPWIFIFSLCLSFSGIMWSANHKSNVVVHEPLFVKAPRFGLELAFLGHLRVYHDYLGLWLIEELVEYSPRKVKMIQSILEQQPQLESLYLLSCFSMIKSQSPEHCEWITKAGLGAFPKGWRIPMTQGFVFAEVIGDLPRAAIYYQIAAEGEGVPLYIQRLAKKLVTANLTRDQFDSLAKGFQALPHNQKIRQTINQILSTKE